MIIPKKGGKSRLIKHQSREKNPKEVNHLMPNRNSNGIKDREKII